MTKHSQFAVISAIVFLLASGAGAAWMLRDHFTERPPPHPAKADYDTMVTRLGGDESAVRDELNFLAATSTAPRDAEDKSRANALTRTCLDPKVLLDIGHVRIFVGAASRGEPMPFHFVSSAHRDRLREIAGDNPTPEKVLAVRRSLANLADEFEAIRLPPDWSVKVEGEKVHLPFHDLLKDASEFMPAGQQPTLTVEPRIPAFAGAEGELLDQLDRYFNGDRARAAFPPAKYPKLYRNGRIPPIPTGLEDYIAEIDKGVRAEKEVLVPVGDAEHFEAVNEVYAKLDRFFSAIIRFGK